MRGLQHWLWTLMPFGLVLASSAATAEENTIRALAPWEAQGKVFQVGPQQTLFVGSFEGIIYVEAGEREGLDAAMLYCPFTREVNGQNENMRAEGRCVIVTNDNGLVFASWACTGVIGECTGNFTVTGGTETFATISGSGEILIRTALIDLIEENEVTTVISKAQGLAVWPRLTIRLPD